MDNQPNSRIFLLFLFVLTITSLIAQAQDHCIRPVVTFSTGAAIAKLGTNTSFQVGLSQYAYAANSPASGAFLGGVFLGTEIPYELILAQVGVGYYQTTQFKASGNLTQGIDALSSNTYPYQYNMGSSQFLLETKILSMPEAFYYPYLTAGVGVAVNRVSQFQETYPALLTFTPLYNNRSNVTFTYSAGAGLDVDAAEHLRIGVGYRFSGLGQANLGSGVIDVVPITNRLTQSNVYANEVFLQFTML